MTGRDWLPGPRVPTRPCLRPGPTTWTLKRCLPARWKPWGRAGDVLVLLSTSGNSPNCLAAARVARERGLETVGLTGAAGGALKALVTVAICIPSTDTQRIQEGHLVAGHLLCEWAEQALAPSR